ncbi:hypothetical protein [Salinicola sp. CPA57]|uniref:hypothetical protein n=1 Tax=Salinicola sp. CPA57 TaxID=1949080 RepID=UPI000DA23E1C|nr:hypothetical protein [Salinicola sp. CPA57]
MAKASTLSYVKKADLDDVYVVVKEPSIGAAIMALGFKLDATDGLYKLNTQDDLEKASIFDKLRSIGLPFMGGSEWSPAEVFEYLREDLQLLSGLYEKAVWIHPGAAKLEMS